MTGDTFGVVEFYGLDAADGPTANVGLVSRKRIPGASWVGDAIKTELGGKR